MGTKTTKEASELFAHLLKQKVSVLRERYVELSQEEMGLRFQRAARQLKNTSLLKKLRCRKARVKAALVVVCRAESGDKKAQKVLATSVSAEKTKEKR